MEIVKVIEKMEEQIEQSARIPMTGKLLIDEDIMLDFLDKLRAQIPEDIRQAQWVTRERERILRDAQAEAERIVMKAKAYVDQQASENEIVKIAEDFAEKTVNQARREAEEMSAYAKTYAVEVLQRLETALNKAMTAVQEGKDKLKEE
ncbi:MAG: ATPase [Clostridia bacterium]|nr:ATPase [Clostridia bacterium]